MEREDLPDPDYLHAELLAAGLKRHRGRGGRGRHALQAVRKASLLLRLVVERDQRS